MSDSDPLRERPELDFRQAERGKHAAAYTDVLPGDISVDPDGTRWRTWGTFEVDAAGYTEEELAAAVVQAEREANRRLRERMDFFIRYGDRL